MFLFLINFNILNHTFANEYEIYKLYTTMIIKICFLLQIDNSQLSI